MVREGRVGGVEKEEPLPRYTQQQEACTCLNGMGRREKNRQRDRTKGCSKVEGATKCWVEEEVQER